MENLENEIWKDVRSSIYYAVSNFGRVKRKPSTVKSIVGYVLNYKERVLTPVIDTRGYYGISISIENKKKRRSIHRMVAEEFIPNPENKPQVNHKNGIKTDNRVENLEWATSKENIIHSFEMGLSSGRRGDDAYTPKLNQKKINQIVIMYKSGEYLQREIADKYGVSQSLISMILSGNRWAENEQN